jgi:hypothetical protein
LNAAFYSLHFHDGDGGVTFTPLLEYRPATSRWGVMLQAGYDSRKGSLIKCLLHVIVLQKTDLSYITIEPKSDLHFLNLILSVWRSTFGFQFR